MRTSLRHFGNILNLIQTGHLNNITPLSEDLGGVHWVGCTGTFRSPCTNCSPHYHMYVGHLLNGLGALLPLTLTIEPDLCNWNWCMPEQHNLGQWQISHLPGLELGSPDWQLHNTTTKPCRHRTLLVITSCNRLPLPVLSICLYCCILWYFEWLD